AATTRALGGVTCGYQDPRRLGVDRWLGIVAARQRTALAFVVAGLGTAATLDFVDAMGRHLGGYIVPGLHLMADSLLRRTADVHVEFDVPPEFGPGTNTADGVNRGVLTMLRDFIVASMGRFESTSGARPIDLFITGGDAGILGSLIARPHHVVEDLVLDGL